MKKATSKKRIAEDDEMLPHYDFSNAKRNHFAKRFKDGAFIRILSEGKVVQTKFIYPKGVVVLDDDLKKLFPDSSAVNNALRNLVEASKSIEKPKRKAA